MSLRRGLLTAPPFSSNTWVDDTVKVVAETIGVIAVVKGVCLAAPLPNIRVTHYVENPHF